MPCPQNELRKSEAEHIAFADYQYIVPRNGVPIKGTTEFLRSCWDPVQIIFFFFQNILKNHNLLPFFFFFMF